MSRDHLVAPSLFHVLSLSLLLPLLASEPAEANQFPSVATTATSCPVDQATKLKNVDPMRSELFLQAPGHDQKVTAIIERYSVDPQDYGARKPKGKANFDWFCFDGVAQRSRGRDKEKFDVTGHAAAAQRIPANANCFFSGVTTSFAGSQKQPAGAPIEVRLGVQAMAPNADSGCFDVNTHCLPGDNRFMVDVEWRDFSGDTGDAVAFPRTDDSGLFYFFNPENTELLLKVIDGCRFNDHFWVFAAAATDVEYTLTVTDTQTNQSRVYDNPLGRPAPAITDTQAFATCP